MLRARAADQGLSERTTFLGNVPRERVPEVMNQAAVYCLPSYAESFGMTVLEAMACGRPVIGTDVSGLGMLLEHNKEMRFPVGDHKALAAVLDRVLASEELRIALGARNLEIATSQYSWDKVMDRLEALYAELLG